MRIARLSRVSQKGPFAGHRARAIMTRISAAFEGAISMTLITTATEQKFTRFLASGFDVIVDRLPRLFRQTRI
jgi:hypothetical protein